MQPNSIENLSQGIWDASASRYFIGVFKYAGKT